MYRVVWHVGPGMLVLICENASLHSRGAHSLHYTCQSYFHREMLSMCPFANVFAEFTALSNLLASVCNTMKQLLGGSWAVLTCHPSVWMLRSKWPRCVLWGWREQFSWRVCNSRYHHQKWHKRVFSFHSAVLDTVLQWEVGCGREGRGEERGAGGVVSKGSSGWPWILSPSSSASWVLRIATISSLQYWLFCFVVDLALVLFV